MGVAEPGALFPHQDNWREFPMMVSMPGNPFDDISVTGRVDFVMKEDIVYKQR